MGVILWILAAVLAWFVARLIPAGRSGRGSELLAAAVAGLLGGLTATALDFGGWRELETRAALLCFLLAFGAVGALRAVRLAAARSRDVPPPDAAERRRQSRG